MKYVIGSIIGIIISIFLFSMMDPFYENLQFKEFTQKETFGLVKGVHISIDDDASDQCWTNIKTVENKARLLLERSNIAVYDKPNSYLAPSFPIIEIGVLAARSGDVCYGAIRLTVIGANHWELGFGSTSFHTPNFLSLLDERSLAFINSDNANALALEITDSFLTSFAADVLAGRRTEKVQEFFHLYPEYAEYTPLSLEEKKPTSSSNNK